VHERLTYQTDKLTTRLITTFVNWHVTNILPAIKLAGDIALSMAQLSHEITKVITSVHVKSDRQTDRQT